MAENDKAEADKAPAKKAATKPAAKKSAKPAETEAAVSRPGVLKVHHLPARVVLSALAVLLLASRVLRRTLRLFGTLGLGDHLGQSFLRLRAGRLARGQVGFEPFERIGGIAPGATVILSVLLQPLGLPVEIGEPGERFENVPGSTIRSSSSPPTGMSHSGPVTNARTATSTRRSVAPSAAGEDRNARLVATKGRSRPHVPPPASSNGAKSEKETATVSIGAERNPTTR